MKTPFVFLIAERKMAVGINDYRNTVNVKFTHFKGNHMSMPQGSPILLFCSLRWMPFLIGELAETIEVKKDM